MNELQLLIDLHRSQQRQGPGSVTATKLALELTGLNPAIPLKIADIGCGTGASSLLLAKQLNAHITAVDFLPEFLDVLKQRATLAGVSDRITPLACSMDSLPFDKDVYDVIWSEGAIYNIGFENGIQLWRPFLKKHGVLVVSEITWTTNDRPAELQTYWDAQYPEINTASSKLQILENNGYSPIGYFVLAEDCWLENYYDPLVNSFPDFVARHPQDNEALSLIEREKEEIQFYRKYKSCYSYGVYIAKKTD